MRDWPRNYRPRGKKVAVLSRGYKSKDENLPAGENDVVPPKVVSDGKRFAESDEAGDEPFMLAHNLPGVVVIIDKDSKVRKVCH